MRQPHRDGYRNTRNDSRHGCHVLFGGCFAEGSDSCSTICAIVADVQVVLRI